MSSTNTSAGYGIRTFAHEPRHSVIAHDAPAAVPRKRFSPCKNQESQEVPKTFRPGRAQAPHHACDLLGGGVVPLPAGNRNGAPPHQHASGRQHPSVPTNHGDIIAHPPGSTYRPGKLATNAMHIGTGDIIGQTDVDTSTHQPSRLSNKYNRAYSQGLNMLEWKEERNTDYDHSQRTSKGAVRRAGIVDAPFGRSSENAQPQNLSDVGQLAAQTVAAMMRQQESHGRKYEITRTIEQQIMQAKPRGGAQLRE